MLGVPSLLVGTGPLPQKALAALPPSASLPTGTQYEVTDYGGNVAIVINGAWRFVAPFRTKWADRPPVGIVPAGTELQVTDYANQKFISDGTEFPKDYRAEHHPACVTEVDHTRMPCVSFEVITCHKRIVGG